MIVLLTTIHIVVCLFLILVVLLQQGKGADLSVFGGGTTQAAFGARGAATLLHKLTVGAFIAFIVTTMGIGFLKSGAAGRSVLSDVPAEEATAEPVTAGGLLEPEADLEATETPSGEEGAGEAPSGAAGEASGDPAAPAGTPSGAATGSADEAPVEAPAPPAGSESG